MTDAEKELEAQKKKNEELEKEKETKEAIAALGQKELERLETRFLKKYIKILDK